MKQIFFSLFIIIIMMLCSAVSSKSISCEESKQTLPVTPDNIGARSGDDVKLLIGTAGLFDQIFSKNAPQACSRYGRILMALVISPSGEVLEAKKIASTFIDDFVEVFLLESLVRINFGATNAQEDSIIYVPFQINPYQKRIKPNVFK